MSSEPVFPNAEREWTRAPHLTTIDRDEVERRIGPTSAALELLAGGHANINLRVGADRVLRIYRRDSDTRAKEEALLQRRWTAFEIPRILGAGDDFLVLEYVPHGPLHATPAHGAAVGRALAEIHRIRFDAAGWFDARLRVTRPFGDIVDAFRAYVRVELGRATWLEANRRASVDALLAAHAGALRREAAAPVLLHGDFKASNLHWTTDGRLLVLDWEFAYAGPALMDIGQLLRWMPAEAFVEAFAASYQEAGGRLVDRWREHAEVFDLVNLAGLAGGATDGTGEDPDQPHRRSTLEQRILSTLTRHGALD